VEAHCKKTSVPLPSCVWVIGEERSSIYCWRENQKPNQKGLLPAQQRPAAHGDKNTDNERKNLTRRRDGQINRACKARRWMASRPARPTKIPGGGGAKRWKSRQRCRRLVPAQAPVAGYHKGQGNAFLSKTHKTGWKVWRSTASTAAAATTSPPAVVLHTVGGGVLPVLAYYTASGGREAGAAQVRHLGQQQQPGLLLSSLPHPCFVRVWCASTYRGHRLLLSCYATASSIYAVPRSMKPGHAEVESSQRRLPVVLLLLAPSRLPRESRAVSHGR
jgi:hypothetical protein